MAFPNWANSLSGINDIRNDSSSSEQKYNQLSQQYDTNKNSQALFSISTRNSYSRRSKRPRQVRLYPKLPVRHMKQNSIVSSINRLDSSPQPILNIINLPNSKLIKKMSKFFEIFLILVF